MESSIRIRAEVVAEIVRRSGARPEVEICGLLAGRGGAITRAFPATNASANASSAYEIAPEEMFRLMRAIRAEPLEFLGIYHSHPRGANEPSPRDIELAYYPGAVYVIVSALAGVVAPVRAFSIRDERVTELQIVSDSLDL